MELGGKCPAIVLDDADLPKAAKMCAVGRTHAPWTNLFLYRAHHSTEDCGRGVPTLTDRSGAIILHQRRSRESVHCPACQRCPPRRASNGSTFLVGNGDWDRSFEDNNTSLNPTIVLNPRGRITDEETLRPFRILIHRRDRRASDRTREQELLRPERNHPQLEHGSSAEDGERTGVWAGPCKLHIGIHVANGTARWREGEWMGKTKCGLGVE